MEELIEEKDIVWAKLSGFPWWPGFVEGVEADGSLKVVFFGDGSYASLPQAKVRLWGRPPELPKGLARNPRLQNAISIARDCVEQSFKAQQSIMTNGEVVIVPQLDETPRSKPVVEATEFRELSRRSTAVEELSADTVETQNPSLHSGTPQSPLEAQVLEALATFCSRRDHHARRVAEGCLERLIASQSGCSVPSPGVCATIARLWAASAAKKGDESCTAMLQKSLVRLVKHIFTRSFGQEVVNSEAEENLPLSCHVPSAESTAASPVPENSLRIDPRQAMRVTRKIAKAVAQFRAQRRLPKHLCTAFACRLEQLISEASGSPSEYRSAVLSFLEHVQHEPRTELHAQCQRFPQLMQELRLNDYFNLQF